MKPFYIVWQPGKPNSYPAVQHATPDEAEKEATRIATKEGKPVHVMELRATVTIETKVVWEYPVWEYPRTDKTPLPGEYCIYCGSHACWRGRKQCTNKP